MYKKINTIEKNVLIDDGSCIPYDKVLIATGASPNLLKLECPPKAPIYTLRTMEDADKIRSSVPDSGNVVFFGAGLVSLQAASALEKKLSQMTFIVGSNQILSQNLDTKSAGIVKERIERRGGRFLFETQIAKIDKLKNDKGITIYTNHGEILRCDALVVGKGVRPNLLETFPNGTIEVGIGILVNEQQQSSTEFVYAAGDVCESTDLISGKRRYIATWPNACAQGWVAGRNMAGGNATFRGSLAMNVTNIFGFSVASVGNVNNFGEQENDEVTHTDASRGIYKKWIFHNDRIVGAILFNELSELSIVTQIIRRLHPIPKEKDAIMTNPGSAYRILSGISQLGNRS